MTLFVVEHTHILGPDDESIKLIGVYSSLEEANEAVQRLRLQPGFCDTPDGFNIDPYTLNEDHWAEGYVTVLPRDEPDDAAGCTTQG